jgi:hypothetical protein
MEVTCFWPQKIFASYTSSKRARNSWPARMPTIDTPTKPQPIFQIDAPIDIYLQSLLLSEEGVSSSEALGTVVALRFYLFTFYSSYFT